MTREAERAALPGGRRAFPQTRHSVIERIRAEAPDVRRDAYGDLVAGYWKPLYAHLRLTWRLSPEDAQDLTQAFFTEAFEKNWLARYDPAKSRFRTFVRVCADRVVLNWRQASSRLKRGGERMPIALDFDGLERDVSRMPSTPPDAEAFFRQEFIRALFGRAVDDVRAEFEAAGKGVYVQLFEAYDLDPDQPVSYADLARRHQLTVAQVTNHLARVRQRFRQHVLDALRALSGSDEHFREEARDLFGVDVDTTAS